jgi:hypothetical protein
MRPAVAPICSWVEVATRRSRRPSLPIGTTTRGATSAAASVSTGSIQSMAATRAMTVPTSRRSTVESRVRSSFTKVKSVVKRCVREAGLSRPSWARSASMRWP